MKAQPPAHDEQARLITEGERIADAQRRSAAVTILVAVATLLFGLAPLVPGTEFVFGSATPLLATAVLTPGVVLSVVCFFLFRRFGFEHRAYRWASVLEHAFLYGGTNAVIFATGLPWTVLWSLCPFTVLLEAEAHPFRARPIVVPALVHGSFSLWHFWVGRLELALVTAAVGLVSIVVFVVAARVRRQTVFSEADRNVLARQLRAQLIDVERERIAEALASRLVQRLVLISAELEALSRRTSDATLALAAKQAQTAVREMSAVTGASGSLEVPASLARLGEALDDKLKALCVAGNYQLDLNGQPEAPVGPGPALAALRIAQELSRNAITHGAAKSLHVKLAHDGSTLTLTVEDDGSGLHADRMSQSTGGLNNAMRWSAECGGTVQRLSSVRGTALRVTLPAMSAQ